ncbi:hypothetical protein KKC08_00380 [Patescibacteria group bacterium]|nr:hypothetical protein [Patescibacteria group bacterium]MCG2701860.1 hypothetical protein [Candidatus Parcubacteria bacterium]MBU4265413.1 hypothetical protein [Patescibacteria group bacterium]MBU4390365.1 hypothetical protein [Patescibacteria group bacterium]MBU4396611.1 hypothetical protein [Patescibacteria group bacterium]
MTETKQGIRVTHVGINVVSEEEYGAIVVAMRDLGIRGEARPVEDHRRIFFEIGDEVEFEVQLWPDGRPPRVHLDIESKDPMGTLAQVGEPIDWGAESVPRGMVRVTDTFMVMTRHIVKE